MISRQFGSVCPMRGIWHFEIPPLYTTIVCVVLIRGRNLLMRWGPPWCAAILLCKHRQFRDFPFLSSIYLTLEKTIILGCFVGCFFPKKLG